MRVLLQTLDHGLQYSYAHILLHSKNNHNHELKIIELKSNTKKKNILEKILFYLKRKKIKSLLMNMLGRFYHREALNAYSRKNININKSLSKLFDVSSDIEINRVNSINEAKDIIEEWKPDIILVIGAPFLPPAYFVEGIIYINLHIGKIPEYRGLKCIEWALLNNDYCAVGYTVHEMTKKIDLGGVYHFENIEFENKSLSDIYTKCYELGINKAIAIALDNKRKIVNLPKNEGSVYYSIDFNAFNMKKLLEKIEI